MKKSKVLTAAMAGVLCLGMSGCGKSSADSKAGSSGDVIQEGSSHAEENSRKAEQAVGTVKYREPESKNVDCKIYLKGTAADCEGTGAEYLDGVLSITKAGCYEISGQLEDGRIEVNASKEDVVEIVLNGVEVSCSDYAPFVVWQADYTLVHLAEGTTNRFADGGSYYDAQKETSDSSGDSASGEAAQESPSAAFFSKDDLGFSGNGELLVEANCNDGIAGRDDLWFTGGTYQITAKDDGIVGKDSIAVQAGTFQITAGGDGMKSTKEEDEQKGFVAVKDGTFTITAANDGIQAVTYVWVEDGSFTITAGGGYGSVTENTGQMDRMEKKSYVQADNAESCKGIKAGVDLSIQGGSFQLDCADDTLHSNDTLTVNDGDFTMKSGDDGIHSDDTAVIAGGKIVIEQSYEGIEAETILIQGGTTRVTSSDDGCNAADGQSAEGMDGPGGRPETMDGGAGSDSCLLSIEGGELYVNAGGDGLDSNGSIVMSGGTVYIDGPVNDGNGILDYEREMLMNGGTLIGAGSAGMLQSVSEESSQPGLAVVFDSGQAAGTQMTLKDSAGKEVLSYTPDKSFRAVVLSDKQLELGETYEVYLNDDRAVSVELSSVSTSYGSAGMGRQPGQGGRREFDGNAEDRMAKPEDGTMPENGMKKPEDGEERPDMPDGRMERPNGAMERPDGREMPDKAPAPDEENTAAPGGEE